MDRISELKKIVEDALYEAISVGQFHEKAKHDDHQKSIDLLTLGLLKEKNKYDKLKISHVKFLKWVIDNIEYINKTLCGGKDLLKRAEQALKEAL